MKKTKRYFSLVLSLLILCGVLISCTSNNNTSSSSTTTTSSSDTVSTNTEVVEPEYIKNRDYGGKAVTIHVRGDDESIAEIGLEAKGDSLSDALYDRTMVTQERLNVEIKTSVQNGWATYNATLNKLRNSIIVGDGIYDIVAGWSARIPVLVAEGLMSDLNSLDTFNSDEAWWSQTITKALTVAGKCYMTTGDIAASYMDSCFSVAVNQNLAQNMGIEYSDLYNVVLEGNWTIEYLYNLTQNLYVDEGNGERDLNDTYGIGMIEASFADSFWSGSGISIIENNGTDRPTLDFPLERVQNVMEAIYKLFYENPGSVLGKNPNEAWTADVNFDLPQLFINDKIVFHVAPLLYLSKYVEMKSTYGILPIPKLDTAQDNYYTNVQQSMSLWCIPIDTEDKEMSAAVMSSLGYDSNKIVITVHYDKLLKNRYASDLKSAHMIDLIYNNIFMNFDTIYNESIGITIQQKDTMPVFVLRTLLSSGTKNVSSWWQEHNNSITSRFDMIINDFYENN